MIQKDTKDIKVLPLPYYWLRNPPKNGLRIVFLQSVILQFFQNNIFFLILAS